MTTNLQQYKKAVKSKNEKAFLSAMFQLYRDSKRWKLKS